MISPRETVIAEEFRLRCTPKSVLTEYTDCKNINITDEGVKKLLLNLDPNKACGPDGISPRLLKIVAEEVTPALTLLVRNSYQTGTLPLDWKLAHVTPVFKKGERYKAENYRPISHTCIACKVMEHIIASHIMSHIKKNSILCPEQHGFRCGRSCETQLLGYMDETSEELEMGNQEGTSVIDFEKALHKVSHTLLVHKLRRYGFGGRPNAWIDSFLENRQQAVVIRGERSNIMPVDSGVLQGSVVGPCFFFLYINDLPIDIESKIQLCW